MGIMSTKKMKGYYIPPELIEFVKKLSEQLNLSESIVVEIAIFHLSKTPKSQQKEILKEYLTKNL
jgi:hypothetical protein